MISILSFAQKQYQLYPDQEEALQKIDHFLHSDLPCFILKGYAGTGKTHLTKILVSYFKQINWHVDLLAPTGRAARILSNRTGNDAFTIHKGIYNLNNITEEKTIKNGKEKYRFRFNLNADLDNVSRAVMVDESSMISDVESHGDFFTFGSGRLLHDMLKLYATKNESRKIKLFFIGDYAQLPPVSDPVSGALDGTYLLKNHGTETSEFELTEIKRQAEGSGILPIADYLRNQLKATQRNSFKLPTSGADVLDTSYTEGLTIFLQAFKVDREKAIMIHYRNRDAFECNQEIRARLFEKPDIIVADDQLIITQNNYNYDPPLLNGTFVRVLNVLNEPVVTRRISSYTANGEEVQVDLQFMKINIEVPTENGSMPLTCRILLNNLLSPDAHIRYEEHIALYIDFKIRHPHLKQGSTAFKDALRADSFFNAVHLKYGYAITCHKAQGGEWDTAIVNMKISVGKLSDYFLRWTYTAITRARKKLVLYNTESQNPYSKLSFSNIILDHSKETSPIKNMTHVALTLTDDEKALIEKCQIDPSDAFLHTNIHVILACLRDTNIRLTKRTGIAYREDYSFREDDKEAFISWHYNAKKQFTSKSSTPGSKGDMELTQQILTILSNPVSYSISMDTDNQLRNEPENSIFSFPEKFPLLADFFEDVKSVLEPKHIRVEKIEHHQYQERYTFTRSLEKAVVNFTYDGKQQITWAHPIKSLCNAQSILVDLEDAFNTLKNS